MDILEHEHEEFLRELGCDKSTIDVIKERVNSPDVRTAVTRFRRFAQENPAVILGALSAVVLGGSAIVARKVMKTAPKRTTKRRKASKRTMIEPHAGDKRYIRRDAHGRIKESVDVGRSLSADRRRSSKTRAKSGQGDKGDR